MVPMAPFSSSTEITAESQASSSYPFSLFLGALGKVLSRQVTRAMSPAA